MLRVILKSASFARMCKWKAHGDKCMELYTVQCRQCTEKMRSLFVMKDVGQCNNFDTLSSLLLQHILENGHLPLLLHQRLLPSALVAFDQPPRYLRCCDPSHYNSTIRAPWHRARCFFGLLYVSGRESSSYKISSRVLENLLLVQTSFHNPLSCTYHVTASDYENSRHLEHRRPRRS